MNTNPQKPATLPKVSVIVPVYNGARTLPRLIESLRAQTYPKDRVEILMVDNGSTDNSRAIIRDYDGIRLLSQTELQSPGPTRNLGARHASGEILVFTDADCRARPDWLDAGVRHMLDAGLDRVAGRIVFQTSARPNFYERYECLTGFRMESYVAEGWAATNNLFIRKKILDDVGGFDVRQPLYGEDYEFGLRATRLGKSLGFCAEAIVCHETRRSFGELLRKSYLCGVGAGQLYVRHGYFDVCVFYRKANYRPVFRTWEGIPEVENHGPRLRFAFDVLSNVLRQVSNFGNMIGYFRAKRRRAAP